MIKVVLELHDGITLTEAAKYLNSIQTPADQGLAVFFDGTYVGQVEDKVVFWRGSTKQGDER